MQLPSVGVKLFSRSCGTVARGTQEAERESGNVPVCGLIDNKMGSLPKRAKQKRKELNKNAHLDENKTKKVKEKKNKNRGMQEERDRAQRRIDQSSTKNK